MQAIILAAGMGKRLGELTHNNTKCMVKVCGITLIDRMLIQLSKINLNRVIIVVGYEGNKLIDYIGNRYENQLKIEFIENSIYDKTNNIYSLALAKYKMQEDDTLLLESDLIFEDQILSLLIENKEPNLALVSKYEAWMDGTMVTIDNEFNIVNFIPKSAFKYEDINIYYKTVNIYKFSKEFSKEQYIPFLDAYSKVMGNNEYYEQVLRVLTNLDRTGLKALPIGQKKWYEIDDVQDLDIAETIFSEDNGKFEKIVKRFGGYWRFPYMLDFCYLVNPYFPTDKMKAEIKANFDILLTAYPSGMLVNSLLGGKLFGVKQDYIVVGNGAAELIKCIIENHTEGKVGIVFPTFEEYPNRLDCNQLVKYIPQNADFSYTREDLQNYFTDKNLSTLLLINPDNPSGNFIHFADVIKLAGWCKDNGIKLIVDESFVDFSENYYQNSLLSNSILDSNPNLLVIKSISKSYGVPGLRLGIFATSDKDLISKIKKEVAIWNINSFAEFYLQIFNKYDKNYIESCEKFILERARFFNDLQQIDFLRIIPSQANYFLCEVIGKYSSLELTELLLIKFNILIKDCGTKSAFAKRNYIRIAIRDINDNKVLIDALKKL